jgi:DNA-binding protein H-NS
VDGQFTLYRHREAINGEREYVARRTTIKFDQLEVAELVHLRDEIESALNGKIEIEREELEARINELAGIQRRRSRKEIRPTSKTARKSSTGSRSGKAKINPLKGSKASPKYRGPNGETWAGRGLAPTWLTALEAKGKKRESFLIKP